MNLKFGDFAGDNREVKANRLEIRRASALSVSRLVSRKDI